MQACNLPANEAETVFNELSRAKLVSKKRRLDGTFLEINVAHEIFSAKEKRTIENFLNKSYTVMTLGELTALWSTTYINQFGSSPKKEKKDFLRLRALNRKLGAKAPDVIVQYIARHRNLKAKCTLLGLCIENNTTV